MNKTLEEIEKVVDKYEKELRKLIRLITYKQGTGVTEEVKLDLRKDSLKNFFYDWLYYNDIEYYERGSGLTSFTKTIQGSQSDHNGISALKTRRSIGDLFRLALSYYANSITLYEVMETMYKLSREATKITKSNDKYYGNVEMQICHTIKKRVFFSRYGGNLQSSYKFNSSNKFYAETIDLDNEFNIYGEDYNKLFNTKEGKEFLKNKLSPAIIVKEEKKDKVDLDLLVLNKLKSLKSKSTLLPF